MWTLTDWAIFLAIVLSFAGCVIMDIYLLVFVQTLKAKVKRLEQDNANQQKLIDKQREYIDKRDKEFRIPNHELTQILDVSGGVVIESANTITEVGRHHKTDG